MGGTSKVIVVCDMCGGTVERTPAQLVGKKHVFCSRRCLWNFSSKSKNPEGYRDLKNYQPMSKHMSLLNEELNPTRMTEETRQKLRESRLGTGEGKTYAKRYGRHEHRVVAEQILGRKLMPGEIVHHMDFNPRNNEPYNIMVFPSQAEHARYHAALNAFLLNGKVPDVDFFKEVMLNEVHTT